MVLHPGQKVGFPVCDLKQVADAVPALGNSQIVELPHFGKRVGGEQQVMDELSRVDRVLAVVTGVMVPTPDVKSAMPNGRIERIFQASKSWSWMIRSINCFHSASLEPRIDRRGPPRLRYLRRREMTGTVGEPRIRQSIRSPAALVIQTQRVGSRVGRRDAIPNAKRGGQAKPWDSEPIESRSVQRTEIRRSDLLVGWRVARHPAIRTGTQRPREVHLPVESLDSEVGELAEW